MLEICFCCPTKNVIIELGKRSLPYLWSVCWFFLHLRPANGGKYCIGEWKKYRLCNTQVGIFHKAPFDRVSKNPNQINISRQSEQKEISPGPIKTQTKNILTVWSARNAIDLVKTVLSLACDLLRRRHKFFYTNRRSLLNLNCKFLYSKINIALKVIPILLFLFQPCPPGSLGFRELQCSQFDKKRVNNRRWKWKPRYSKGKVKKILEWGHYLNSLPNIGPFSVYRVMRYTLQ